MSDLTETMLLIEIHHERHPDHGLDCACMDKYIGRLRKMFKVTNTGADEDTDDPKLQRRIDYVIRKAVER